MDSYGQGVGLRAALQYVYFVPRHFNSGMC